MQKSSQKPCIQILDEVSQVLTDIRLKLAENVWASDVSIKSENLIKRFLQSKTEFDNGCKLLWTLKDHVNVIEPIYQCLNAKLKEMLREMETALIHPSYHYGLESVPHENFMRIMDLLAETCTTYKDRMRLVKNLSSVSRRFRDGVVNTTSFWVYWDIDYCLDDGFEHRLARTKEAPLFIDLAVDFNDQELFTRILPHRTRWHRVELFLPNEGVPGSKFPMADFPSVRSLVISTVRSHGNTFFAEWTFPNVSSVVLCNVIAPPGAFPKATSLRLRGGPVREDYLQYIPTVTTLLRSMPALTTLDLDVSYTMTTESLTVELPSITTFSIANHKNRYHITSLASLECTGQFTKALKLPNVENFILQLRLKDTEEGENWLSKIFTEGVPFRSVKHFRLTITSMISTSLTLFFDGFSSRFPNLHSLRVKGLKFHCNGLPFGSIFLAKSFDRHEGRFPHLHSLTVLNMDNDWTEWFYSLLWREARIDHLSVSEVDGIGLPQFFSNMLKWNNPDIKLEVLPRTVT